MCTVVELPGYHQITCKHSKAKFIRTHCSEKVTTLTETRQRLTLGKLEKGICQSFRPGMSGIVFCYLAFVTIRIR